MDLTTEKISSLQNPRVKQLVRLRDRRPRDEAGVFLVEGYREIRRALEKGVALQEIYIDRAYSERSGMQVVRAIGGRAPLHLTSVGKLFLADDDSVKLKNYVSKTGLNGHTQNSISDLTQLEKELDLVKSLGHARDDEELELGVSCMAAAILDDTGKLVAGLSLSAPTERMQDEWLKSLKDTAMQISKSLGYKPSVKSS